MPERATHVVFETHSWSEDNDRGVASGWGDCGLTEDGRQLARELGARRRVGHFAVALVSDLRRASETASIAFEGDPLKIVEDPRLRECDFGDLTGKPIDEVRTSVSSVHDRHPGGESWAEAVGRVLEVIDEIEARWSGKRVLVIGHMSAYWALEHRVNGMPLEDVGRHFVWQEGWEYDLPRALG